MLVKNENNELVELKTYANEIISEGLGDEIVTEEEVENVLAELYVLQYKEQSQMFLYENESFVGLTIESINKSKLLEWIREAFCAIASTDIFDNVIEKIIEIVVRFFPFISLFKDKVKKIIKHFLQKGIAKICPA